MSDEPLPTEPVDDGAERGEDPAPLVPERLPALALPDSTPADFRESLEGMRAKREALYAYIRSQLEKGVDFDHVGRDNKNTLLKPGGEKIAAVLQLRPVFEKDDETLAMLGKAEGVVCYRCTLVTTDGQVIGEGKGACEPSERPVVNTRIKIALKRAQIDAVLRVAALSGHFTQDLEDGGVGADPSSGSQSPPAAATSSDTSTSPASPAAGSGFRDPRTGQPIPPPAPVPPPPPPSGATDPRTGRPRTAGPAPVGPPPAEGPGGMTWVVPQPQPDFEAPTKDGGIKTLVGNLHFQHSEQPSQKRGGAIQHFFAPSEHERATFTKEEPWSTWNGLTWGQLCAYSLKHRVARAQSDAAGEHKETNRFNDPILAILNDTYACWYKGRATKLAETACAANGIVWDAYDRELGV